MFLARKQQVDPLTGDPITRQERLSILAQSIMRQWKFVIFYTVVTIAWWAWPALFGDTHAYVHWQLAASYMALLIESVVGIGMFGWARRDSVILRTIAKLEAEADRWRDLQEPVMRAVAKELGVEVPEDDRQPPA